MVQRLVQSRLARGSAAADAPQHSMKPCDDARPDGAQTLLPVSDGHCPAGQGQSFPWLTAVGFGFLTFNSAMAVYRSHGDRETVAFVAFSYLDLMALFYCLRRFENAKPGSRLRDRLKVAVWLLTTALTILFSVKVAAVMPPAVAVAVWLMAFGTIAGGFYAFFCFRDKQ